MARCTSGGRWRRLGQHPVAGRTSSVLGIPAHIEPVAYLCLGYVDNFGNEPELERVGWERRASLESVIFEETYPPEVKPEDPLKVCSVE